MNISRKMRILNFNDKEFPVPVNNFKALCCIVVFAVLSGMDLSGQIAFSDTSNEGPIKAGTIRIRKNGLDSASQFLIGTWNFCHDEKFSKNHSCLSPLSIFEFKEDGTYTEMRIVESGSKKTVGGIWKLNHNTLKTTPSVNSGVKQAFMYKITWLNSQLFYNEYKNQQGEIIYYYFEKRNAGKDY